MVDAIIEISDGEEIHMSPEEYAAQWGCDPQYDRKPREYGDGYLFYNFGVEGNDPEFLKKFLPAISRTIQCAEQEGKPQADIDNLNLLKAEVEERLAR